MEKKFLYTGLILSGISKILQITNYAIIGDVLILCAAPLLVLAVLFYIPKYKMIFDYPKTRPIAIKCAIFSCLTIFFFQLFTMISFGWKRTIGFVFIFPFALSAVIVIESVWQMYKNINITK